MARELHECGVEVQRSFDFHLEAKRYESMLLEKGPIDISGYDDMSARFERLASYVHGDNAPKCLSHNDFFELNFLVDEGDAYHLIDWEYAGMSDYANDFGTFCVCCQLDEKEAEFALAAYRRRRSTVTISPILPLPDGAGISGLFSKRPRVTSLGSGCMSTSTMRLCILIRHSRCMTGTNI